MYYAITFELETVVLEAIYPDTTWINAYTDIKKILAQQGFEKYQGCVYVGNETVDAVKCVLAVQMLSKSLPWFKSAVREIQMLRIDEINDLAPALE